MIALAYARLLLIALSFLVIGFSPAVAQEDEKFMPKGGKTLFLELTDSPRAASCAKFGVSHTEAEWRGFWLSGTRC
jgi:hypothetical protein